MRRLVVDFADVRPIFRFPNWAADRLRTAVPQDWEVVVVEAPTMGTADGADAASPQALAAVEGAEVYLGFGVPAAVLRAGTRLRWVHSGTAGVGGSLTREMLESDVVFTNSAGVHAVPVAETVLAMMLYFARGLDHAVRAQARGQWDKAAFDTAEAPVREVGGSTVGVVGYGGIGTEVARRAHALGARVIALRRREPGADAWARILVGAAGLDTILRESDYLVLAAPETPETRGLIDAEALGRMRAGAVLVNVARGRLVDEAALVDALEAGRLCGAALDVFATEPLPPGHRFWSLPNVLLTPHVSAYSHRFWEREIALVEENLRRYLEGEEMVNVVNKREGY